MLDHVRECLDFTFRGEPGQWLQEDSDLSALVVVAILIEESVRFERNLLVQCFERAFVAVVGSR